MNDFYSTNGGRKFIDGTMVRIADSLDEINKSLKTIVAKESSEVRSYVDDEMYLSSPLEADHDYMAKRARRKKLSKAILEKLLEENEKENKINKLKELNE